MELLANKMVNANLELVFMKDYGHASFFLGNELDLVYSEIIGYKMKNSNAKEVM
jgi:hypothetical protein